MKLTHNSGEYVTLIRDPIGPMEAATKQYADVQLLSHINSTNLHLSVGEKTFLTHLTVSAEQLNDVVSEVAGFPTQILSKLDKTGGTMTGNLFLFSDPTLPTQAATKNYVDDRISTRLDKAGGTMTGFILLHAEPTSGMHPATKTYVDNNLSTHSSDTFLHLGVGQKTFLNNITATASEINYTSGVTAPIQSQIDSKLSKSGGTMTGGLTLVGPPLSNNQATTKEYVDDGLNARLRLVGGTMTGELILSGAPTSNLAAATKKYVDDSLTTHVNNTNLHLGAGQRALLDAIEVSATQINQLQGVSSNVQSQLDNKLDKTGGTLTGDLTFQAGKTAFVNKTPLLPTELVNKGYVDALIQGQAWKHPISTGRLMGVNVTNPSSITDLRDGDTYIVGNGGEGDWAGEDGYAVFWKEEDNSWNRLQNRKVQIDDRFGFSLNDVIRLDGDPSAGVVMKVTGVEDAFEFTQITFVADTLSPRYTTIVFDNNAADFGITYSINDEGEWILTNTSVNLSPGAALSLDGKLLNLQFSYGLTLTEDNELALGVRNNNALGFDENHRLQLLYDTSSISVDSNLGIQVKSTLVEKINNSVQKTGTNTVEGTVLFTETAKLQTEFEASGNLDVINKGFLDNRLLPLTEGLSSAQYVLEVLTDDPVTKTYVDELGDDKLSLSGGTMTGALNLHAGPSSSMHAATKQYVDSTLSNHTEDADLHLTSGQNTFLDALTVSSAEVNYLAGVTSAIQTQINSKLSLAGGTMTGYLTLNAGDPLSAKHATTKEYVDGLNAAKLSTAGGTMTGALVLSYTPTVASHAVHKQYVDNALQGHTANTDIHVTSTTNTWLTDVSTNVIATEAKTLAGVTSSIQDQLNARLNKAGGTMTGNLFLAGDPTLPLHAATRSYVLDGLSGKLSLSGGTLTGPVVSVEPTLDGHITNKEYVDLQDSTLWTNVQSLLATSYLSLSGGTMTGLLTLSGGPTNSLHAATKAYVDGAVATLNSSITTTIGGITSNVVTLRSDVDGLLIDTVKKSYVDANDNARVLKAGDTLTGFLTLHADPTSAMHAVTKQYVDAVTQNLSIRPAVRLATTENLAYTYSNGSSGINATLTAPSNGVLTVDGKTVTLGDRILVRDQTTKIQNGDYVVQQPGDAGTPAILRRVTSADESSEIPGSYFTVFDGDTLKNTTWVLVVANPKTFAIGTDDISVNQFSGPGSLIPNNGLTLVGNTLSLVSASASRIKIDSNGLDLATTGVSTGTYRSVTVDTYGRVTGGSNPTTLAGYNISDGQALNAKLTAISGLDQSLLGIEQGVVSFNSSGDASWIQLAVDTNKGLILTKTGDSDKQTYTFETNGSPSSGANTLVQRNAAGSFSANVITANSFSGNATTATTLQTARTISVTGTDIQTTTAASFNGSANVTVQVSLTQTGVTDGTYTKVTVDDRGRITVGENPTTLSEYGIIDAASITYVNNKIQELEDKLNDLYNYVMTRV